MLVSPSGNGSLPYVRRGFEEVTSFQNVTKHHSHLYRINNPNEQCITLRLVHHSWEAAPKNENDPNDPGVDSPHSITLSEAESDRIREAIAKEEADAEENGDDGNEEDN